MVTVAMCFRLLVAWQHARSRFVPLAQQRRAVSGRMEMRTHARHRNQNHTELGQLHGGQDHTAHTLEQRWRSVTCFLTAFVSAVLLSMCRCGATTSRTDLARRSSPTVINTVSEHNQSLGSWC